jgi:hypothetical protein
MPEALANPHLDTLIELLSLGMRALDRGEMLDIEDQVYWLHDIAREAIKAAYGEASLQWLDDVLVYWEEHEHG